MNNKDLQKIKQAIDELILEITGKNTLKEAEKYFEDARNIGYPKNEDTFFITNVSQLAVLFRLKKDTSKYFKTENNAKVKKKPRISEETKKFIEFEVPEGKLEEYDLPENCDYIGNGQDLSGNCFEYHRFWKQPKVNLEIN